MNQPTEVTAPTIQPGTPCQCTTCPDGHKHTFECGDAVRMVTVRDHDLPGHKSIGGWLLQEITNDANAAATHAATGIGFKATHGFAPNGDPVHLLWYERYPAHDVPMCEPCAAFHEAKEGTR